MPLVRLLFIPLMFLCSLTFYGQQDSIYYYPDGIIINGDTIPCVTLPPAEIDYLACYEKNKKFYKKYERLQRRVQEMYPYAKMAGVLMKQYEAELENLETKRDQKRYLKDAEDQLKAEFEGEIRNMTMRDGIVLIKLIDRETGDTSYELIQELRGGFSAFMWQGVARLFGSNLKEDYDPDMEDAMIEDIVQRIERGELEVARVD